jgi:hypothetical protein
LGIFEIGHRHQPKVWVMVKGGRAASVAVCGVTPQTQNTGSSPDVARHRARVSNSITDL